jgi:hypothetical protein
MANRKVGIFVMFEQDGKRRTKAATDDTDRMLPKPPGGVFYIRWYEGTRQRWKQVGDVAWDALNARGLQEDVLAGKRPPEEERPEPKGVTVTSAIESFLLERSTQTDDRGVARWRLELELFAQICGKTRLREVGREDCFSYMRWYQQRKKAPRKSTTG